MKNTLFQRLKLEDLLKLFVILSKLDYAEQDRRESLKETFKPITDELEKVDEGIYKLKDELKDLKTIEGPPALPAIEGPQAAVTIDDYMTKEEQESVMEHGYPDIAKMVDDPDLRIKTLKRLEKESKSLVGKKGSTQGQRKTEIEKQLKANSRYRKTINSLPKPQTCSSIFYYSNPRDLFDRFPSSWRLNHSRK